MTTQQIQKFGTLTDIGNLLGISAVSVGKHLTKEGYREKSNKNTFYASNKALSEGVARKVWERYYGKKLVETVFHKPKPDEKLNDYMTTEWNIKKSIKIICDKVPHLAKKFEELNHEEDNIAISHEEIPFDFSDSSTSSTYNMQVRGKRIKPIICPDNKTSTRPCTDFPYATFPYEKFNPVQTSILPYIATDYNLVVATNTSSGKAQPLSSKVLTPCGYIRMGDLSIGDLVISCTGKPTPITGIYPQGMQDVYEITFSDNSKTHCTKDHIWPIYKAGYRNKKRDGVIGCRNWTLEELIDNPLSGKYKDQHRWFRYIPMTKPTHLCRREVKIDPYLMGLFICNGKFIQSSIGISLSEKDIINRVEIILHDLGYNLIKDNSGQSDNEYRIISSGPSTSNKLKSDFEYYGLKNLPKDKCIPQDYLINSIESRVNLLQGLLDSNGAIDIRGHIEFFTSNENLVKDVVTLVQSLGGTATSWLYNPYSGVNPNKNTSSYRVYIKMPKEIIPVSSLKHLSRYKADRNTGVYRQIRNIKRVGNALCQCISVECDTQTYLTDNCIVTHNTTVAEMCISHSLETSGKSGIYVGPLKALTAEKKEEWTNENHCFSKYRISECSGDYQITQKRVKELDNAQIISITPEMLSSRCRNIDSEKSKFLTNSGIIVLDEAHIIGMVGRGDSMESAIIQLSGVNPDIRFVLLTATMSNASEICEWLSSLNGKPTVLLESTYRPVELVKNIIPYNDKSVYDPHTGKYRRLKYHEIEQEKTRIAIQTILKKPDEKFLVFYHSKSSQRAALKMMADAGIDSAVYNADQKKENRDEMLSSFKMREGGLRVLLATSSLAMGCHSIDDYIYLSNGNVILAGDIKHGDIISSPKGRTKVKWAKKINRKKSLKITLVGGRSCHVTMDHPFLSINKDGDLEWITANKLSVKDSIATQKPNLYLRKCDFDTIENATGYVIGCFIGNGCMSNGWKTSKDKPCPFFSISFDKKDKEIAIKCRELLSKVIGIEMQILSDRGNHYLIKSDNKKTIAFFQKWFSIGKKKNLSIPEFAFNNHEILVPLLSGLFDTDGSVYTSGSTTFIEFSTIHEKLAKQVHNSLAILGINSEIRKKPMSKTGYESKNEHSWVISIARQADILQFESIIGFQNPRKKAILSDSSRRNKWFSVKSSKYVPYGKLIKRYAKDNNSINGIIKKYFPNGISRLDKDHTCISRDRFDSFINEIPLDNELKDKFDELYNIPIEWKRIKSIEVCNGGKFLELEVDSPNKPDNSFDELLHHSYIAEGFISHNCNLPARNVIIVGCTRGMNDVPISEMIQEQGRCGRPQYDTEGFVFYILPQSRVDELEDKLSAGCVIDSTFAIGRQTDYESAAEYHKRANDDKSGVENTIAFHAISEIANGIDTKKDLQNWFKYTLAYHQSGKPAMSKIENVIEALQKASLIKNKDNKLSATILGKISSDFYFAPFDTAGLYRNINSIENQQLNDEDWAYILSNVNTHSNTYLSNTELGLFDDDISKASKYKLITPNIVKTFWAYYKILQGQTDTFLTGLQSQLMQDSERICAVLGAIDSYYKYQLGNDIKVLSTRLRYGVPAYLASLVLIDGIGARRSSNLYNHGIRSYEDFISAPNNRISQIIGIKNEETIDGMKRSAHELLHSSFVETDQYRNYSHTNF